jgi:hypothetical protein
MNVISYDGYINHYEHGLMTIGRSGYPQVFDHGTRVGLYLSISPTVGSSIECINPTMHFNSRI